MSAYKPSMRDRLAYFLARNWYGDTRKGVDQAKNLTNVLETVTPFGVLSGAYDAGRSAGSGDYVDAGVMGAMAMAPGLRTKGGKAILPHETGWVFKDVKHPHKVMEKGDWRLANMLDPQTVELPIGKLNATQPHVNPDFSSPVTRTDQLPFVLKKNGEYYVQDGHHRLTKIAMEGKQTAKVRLVDLDQNTQADFPLVDLMQANSIPNN